MEKDTVSLELRSRWDAKREECERTLLRASSLGASADEIKARSELTSKGADLKKEMEEIGLQIKQYAADREREKTLLESLARDRKQMEMPNRRLPFSSGASTASEDYEGTKGSDGMTFKTIGGDMIRDSIRSES